MSSIPANNFQLFRIVQDKQVEVRILAEFEDHIILFDYDAREPIGVEFITEGSFENKRKLEYMYYGYDREQGGQTYAVLFNLITGRHVKLKYVNTYEWSFFRKNGRDLIRFTTYTQEEKRTGSLMWDDGQAGFSKIPIKEWEKLGGFPKVGSRPEQLEAQGYLQLKVSANGLTWERYQALLELQRDSSVNTEEEVRQFIRNYLQILGFRELRDLGDGRYYMRINDNLRPFNPYAILDLNATENAVWNFRHLYDSLYVETVALFVLRSAHFFPYRDSVALDWISKPVDGKIYCLIPTYEGGGYNVFSDKHEPLPIRKTYEKLYIYVINGEKSGEKETDIKVLSYKERRKTYTDQFIS